MTRMPLDTLLFFLISYVTPIRGQAAAAAIAAMQACYTGDKRTWTTTDASWMSVHSTCFGAVAEENEAVATPAAVPDITVAIKQRHKITSIPWSSDKSTTSLTYRVFDNMEFERFDSKPPTTVTTVFMETWVRTFDTAATDTVTFTNPETITCPTGTSAPGKPKYTQPLESKSETYSFIAHISYKITAKDQKYDLPPWTMPTPAVYTSRLPGYTFDGGSVKWEPTDQNDAAGTFVRTDAQGSKTTKTCTRPSDWAMEFDPGVRTAVAAVCVIPGDWLD